MGRRAPRLTTYPVVPRRWGWVAALRVLRLDPDDGMPRECTISLDNLPTVPKALLVEPITQLEAAKMTEVCAP